MKIVLGTHDDLIKQMGNEIVGSALEKRIKDGTAKFYLVSEDNKTIHNFWIFINRLSPTNVDLCIYQNPTNSLIYNKEIMNLIFERLKTDGYKSIEIGIFNKYNSKSYK